MNRADGLVQRRRTTAKTSNSSGSSGTGNSGQVSSNDASGHNDGQSARDVAEDGSSIKDLNSNPATEEDSDKETRLTLMEEVLLLGLKDKEVGIRKINFLLG